MENNNSIDCEMRVLSGCIRRYFENSPNRKKLENLTGSNSRIVVFLLDRAGKDVFQRDIEKEFGITRSTASKVIELMRKKGYIEKQSVPYDARLKKLVLTEKANELSEYLLEDRETLGDNLALGFTEKEKEKIAGYIRQMRKNMEALLNGRKGNI